MIQRIKNLFSNVKVLNKDRSNIKEVKNPHAKQGRTKLKLIRWHKFFSKRFVKEATLLVAEMQLATGDDKEFHVVQVINNSFKLFGKRYLTDPEYMVYNRTLKMYVSEYHENISLPIKKVIDAEAIRNEVEHVLKQNNVNNNISSNLDPNTLERFVKSTVIEKVFNGSEMNALFMNIWYGILAIGFVSIVILFILLGTSGIMG